MLKCDYCKKKIDTPYNVVQLDIVWWFQGDGINDKGVTLGEFHEECAKKFINELKVRKSKLEVQER